jgi:HupE / UreJ protein
MMKKNQFWQYLACSIALTLSIPSVASAGLVGVLAIFHGYAHGAEMPETASGLTYCVGYISYCWITSTGNWDGTRDRSVATDLPSTIVSGWWCWDSPECCVHSCY